jgi:hypothetical protein
MIREVETTHLGETVGTRLWQELLVVIGELEAEHPSQPNHRGVVDAALSTVLDLAAESGYSPQTRWSPTRA